MKYACLASILGLLVATASAEIVVDETYKPHEPITASLEATYPDGARVDGGWESSTAKIRTAGALDQAHVWAPPGKHSLRFLGVWLQTREVTIDGETVQILQDFGFLREQATFEVTEYDGPDPPPPPPPDERRGIIIEETSERTPEQASLWSRLTRATTIHELLIVDQDSSAESLEIYQQAAREYLRKSGAALPVLVVVSSDDGSVVDVMECPETVDAIKQELGL